MKEGFRRIRSSEWPDHFVHEMEDLGQRVLDLVAEAPSNTMAISILQCCIISFICRVKDKDKRMEIAKALNEAFLLSVESEP